MNLLACEGMQNHPDIELLRGGATVRLQQLFDLRARV